MTMEQITVEDVQAAYGDLLSALRETYEQNPVLWYVAFGDTGPPYEQWVDLIETYIAGSPSCAQIIADNLGRDVLPLMRSNAGEAARDESGRETSQALSDPVVNMRDTVADWTDEAGIEFVRGYLMGQYGLQNKLQYQHEFAVALPPVMLAQQGVLLYARAGVIDILGDAANALREATAERRRRRRTIGDMLRDTLVETGVAALTGRWVTAAAAAVTGVAEAAITDLTWPDTDHPGEICVAMVDNFDTLRADLEERAAIVEDTITVLCDELAGLGRETLLPLPTIDPDQVTQPRRRHRQYLP